MPPNPPAQHNIIGDEPEFKPEDIGLPGMDVEVTIREVLAVNVYSRLYDEFFLRLDTANAHTEAVNSILQIYPGLDDEYGHLTQYSRSIEVIGRRYKKLIYDCTKYATDAELGAMLSQVANGYAFSGGQISWDGIAFVIMMVRQVVAERVASKSQGARDLFVMNWCIDYFSHPPPINGDRSINTWVEELEYGWKTLLEPYNTYMNIAPDPIQIQLPADFLSILCQCKIRQSKFWTKPEPTYQCRFCSVFWCTIQDCEFMCDHPLSLISHQTDCHRYPSQFDEIIDCPTCNTQQPTCTNYVVNFQKCAGHIGDKACQYRWCLVDGCKETRFSFMQMVAHQNQAHPSNLYKCKICGVGKKVRYTSATFNVCSCEALWCLIGHCREEFDNMQALEHHQINCSYILNAEES